MPKIVLVDDEIWALRGLESLLQEYPEYTVAATFTNGAGSARLFAHAPLRRCVHGFAYGSDGRPAIDRRLARRNASPCAW